jgi:hypothetical protein
MSPRIPHRVWIAPRVDPGFYPYIFTAKPHIVWIDGRPHYPDPVIRYELVELVWIKEFRPRRKR